MNPRERATVGCRKCGSIYFAEPALCADCLAKDRAAVLEQARREAIEQYREKAFEPFSRLEYIGRMTLWQHLQDTAASLLSAPEVSGMKEKKL